MNEKITVSVVIPAYNEENYIGKTLASIQKLERRPDEVIVIDGASTDTTVSVAKKYGAKTVTVEHRGIGYARQKGVEAASGDIIAFTDADTIVPRDWLQKIVDSLSQPGVSGVFGDYRVDDGAFFYRWFINSIYPLIWHSTAAFGMHFPGGQNIAFWKAKALEVGGFPVDFKSVEDFEMMKRLAAVGKVVYRNDNSVTSSGRRGDEGIVAFTVREVKGMLRYFFTGKADTFTFPDVR